MTGEIRRVSEDTLTLEALLRALRPGQVAGYGELSEAIGRNVQMEGYSCLTTARNRCLRDGLVFETITRVGLRAVVNGDQTVMAQKQIGRMNRRLRKTRRELDTVEPGELTTAEKNAYNIESARVNVLANLTNSRRVVADQKRLADKSYRSDGQAERDVMAATLAAFRNGKLKSPK